MFLFNTFIAISLSLNLCVIMDVIIDTMGSHTSIREVIAGERQDWASWKTWRKWTVFLMPIYLRMFYITELSYNSTDRQVKSMLNLGWNISGRNSVLITAVMTCNCPSQLSSTFRPRAVLRYKAWKGFTHHWNKYKWVLQTDQWHHLYTHFSNEKW